MKKQHFLIMDFNFLNDQNGTKARFSFNAEKGSSLWDILHCLEYAKECINDKIIECQNKLINEINEINYETN